MAKNKAADQIDDNVSDADYKYVRGSIPELKDVEMLEEQLGFAPYYNPIPGEAFYAVPVHFDMDLDRDRGFDRWVFQAQHPMQCFRGPKGEEQEKALVRKGEFFSTSVYAQLRLHLYLGLPVELTCQKKVPAKKGSMWVFTMAVTPDTKAKIQARRDEQLAQALAAKSPAARQLAESRATQ
jgi:hypothetical protein